ncbi:MAG: AAA family ATPase [Myxococcales bacterium]|nr:AAA family ATPase [Myxococcales bacterium]
MELVLFTGLQASGKSSFYKERFFRTHVRVNLDMLKTRNRERLLLDACFEAKQPMVVDNTNPTVEARALYIVKARAAGFRVSGYYFGSRAGDCLERNARRPDAERIPDKGVLATARRLERPNRVEGFDELFYVALTLEGFVVEEWSDEV